MFRPSTTSSDELSSKVWCVYILECADGSYYTGISNQLLKRVQIHNAGRGAKYTQTRRPVNLVAFKAVACIQEALKLERLIKRKPRTEKIDCLKRIGLFHIGDSLNKMFDKEYAIQYFSNIGGYPPETYFTDSFLFQTLGKEIRLAQWQSARNINFLIPLQLSSIVPT